MDDIKNGLTDEEIKEIKEGENIGYTEDAPGSKSMTRLMSFIFGIAALVYIFIPVFKPTFEPSFNVFLVLICTSGGTKLLGSAIEIFKK